MRDIRNKISGISKRLENKIVCFRKDIKARTLDNSTSIRISKGTVGTLTGGFSNKKMKNGVVSFLDIQVSTVINMRGSRRRHLSIVSVPINFLKFGTDEGIN